MLTPTRIVPGDWQPDPSFEPLGFEKVVGLDNLLRIAWLSRGLELAAPVCRVMTPGGAGSGFLIANDLLLTNNHVLPDTATVDQSSLQFNYQADWAGDLLPVRTYTMDSSHFQTSVALDYAIVRVNGSPGDLAGFVDLTRRAAPTVNDYVSIIQHPLGGLKQIALTDNKVSAVFGNLVQYATDTEPGSSGSPVFDQQWQIVGLHHRGGDLAGPDGKTYFTNEGILISAVIRDAAAFLGLPDTLYDLAFSDLRAQLVGLINPAQPPTDLDALAAQLLLTAPRLSGVLDDWSNLNGKPADPEPLTLAIAGVAIGAAMRQWARNAGHEAITAVADPPTPPTPALVGLIGPFNGTTGLPSDVYTATLTALAADSSPVASIAAAVAGADPLAAPARAFIRAVAVGAAAYGPVTPLAGAGAGAAAGEGAVAGTGAVAGAVASAPAGGAASPASPPASVP